MPDPRTWATTLFGGGGDDLAEADRRVAILKAELEAIRAGRKKASAAELRKLQRDYRDAVTKVVEARRAQAPPTPTVGAIRGPITRPPAEPGRVGGVAGGAMAVTTPRGYAAPPAPGIGELWQRRPHVQAGPGVRPPDAGPGVTTPRGYMGGPGMQPPSAIPGTAAWQAAGAAPALLPPPAPTRYRPPGSAVAASERRQRGLTTGVTPRYARAYIPPAAGGAGGDYGLINPFFAMLTPEQQQQYIAQQLGGMNAYQQAQIGQQQSTAAATAAWRQQQQEQAQAQLRQAWAVAQAELAHAQNVMASQIGTAMGQTQSQIWAQGLPHALPRGTQVAPGFERGGPMSQLSRMSGSQFRPGVTGRISPQPGPSQQQLMGWVQQAMGRYGAGR